MSNCQLFEKGDLPLPSLQRLFSLKLKRKDKEEMTITQTV